MGHDISEHKKNKNTLWLFEFILFKKVSKLQDAIITIDTVKCTCTSLTSEFHIYTMSCYFWCQYFKLTLNVNKNHFSVFTCENVLKKIISIIEK